MRKNLLILFVLLCVSAALVSCGVLQDEKVKWKEKEVEVKVEVEKKINIIKQPRTEGDALIVAQGDSVANDVIIKAADFVEPKVDKGEEKAEIVYDIYPEEDQEEGGIEISDKKVTFNTLGANYLIVAGSNENGVSAAEIEVKVEELKFASFSIEDGAEDVPTEGSITVKSNANGSNAEYCWYFGEYIPFSIKKCGKGKMDYKFLAPNTTYYYEVVLNNNGHILNSTLANEGMIIRSFTTSGEEE